MNTIKLIFTSLVITTLVSCGKNEDEKTIRDSQKKEVPRKKVITKNSTQLQDNSSFQTHTDSIKSVKESVLTKQKIKKKQGVAPEQQPTTLKTADKTLTTKTKAKKITASSFVYLKKILENCKIGEPMTQEDLETKFKIPKEAMKLVKSVTKTAENELDVKWKSTWLVEKVSDAKFNDGKIKMRFDNNKMYMSGGAIGIKYENKMYTDLILIGRSAYIPTVKGYHWQIGKDH